MPRPLNHRSVLILALTLPLFAGGVSQTMGAQTRDPLQDAKSLFDAQQPAAAAVSMLRRDYRVTLDQSTVVLRTAGFTARALVPALRAEYSPSISDVYSALTRAGFPAREVSVAFAGNLISLDCIDPRGFSVPCGNFGGLADESAMGQVTWTPKPEGMTNTTLQVAASKLPPVFVRIGSLTLAEVSTSPGTLTVRLPATPTNGPLTLVRKSDNVSGLLQDDYRVVSPPIPWMTYATVAIDGALADMKHWMSGARMATGCVVNGALAHATIGHFTSSTGPGGELQSRLVAAGASTALANAWDSAFRGAFTTYTANVTIPSLPLFPALATVAAQTAPAVSNVPTPLGLFLSVGAVAMQLQSLGPAVAGAIAPASVDEPPRAAAVAAFAAVVSARFNTLLAQAFVAGLMGGGPVPKYAPPLVSAAPVEGGSCSGTGIVVVPPGVL